jgi:hypothetical protein
MALMMLSSFIMLAICRTAARRARRRSLVAMSTDAEFTVAKAQAAIPDLRKAGGDE